jgi:hypothetical protein
VEKNAITEQQSAGDEEQVDQMVTPELLPQKRNCSLIEKTHTR